MCHTAQPKQKKKKKALNVKCPQCRLKFSKINSMHQHLDRVHNGKRYHCPVPECGKNLSSAYRLRTHMAKLHNTHDVNTKSSIVTIDGDEYEYEIAPEAKSQLILVQQEEIEKLEKQIVLAQKRLESLKKQLKSTE